MIVAMMVMARIVATAVTVMVAVAMTRIIAAVMMVIARTMTENLTELQRVEAFQLKASYFVAGINRLDND